VTPPPRGLEPNEVHVWHLLAEQAPDVMREPRWLAMLSDDEAVRLDRYRQPRDRLHFLLARVLTRSVLAGYLGTSPHELRFHASVQGKPVLSHHALRFNLSHSQGAVVCAVSASHEVGVDVEDAGRDRQLLDLAERYFAPDETEHLRRLDDADRPAAFFAIWTLKEAFVKALGQGLAFPLDAFCFDLDRDRLVGFRPLHPSVSPDWHFTQFTLSPRHRGAVAVPCPQGTPPHVSLRNAREWFA
jgi:4'-phosphopantetheinyl transferase